MRSKTEATWLAGQGRQGSWCETDSEREEGEEREEGGGEGTLHINTHQRMSPGPSPPSDFPSNLASWLC